MKNCTVEDLPMLFNSLSYVVFLPAVFLIYWILPHRFRWLVLLIASYYFYMSWNIKYIALIFLMTVISYGAGLILEKCKNPKARKKILIGTIVFCLLVLFLFKYINFTSRTISAVLSKFAIQLQPITLDLLLPVGISFYTFQVMSYVVDVYKNNIKAESHFGIYATFVSFFPQLVAGPIERTSSLLPQIKKHHFFDEEIAISGAKLMLWGYFKKLIIADNVAPYINVVYENLNNYKGVDLLLVIFLFTIQIYCDFSGYSDIAIGTAKLLDINLTINFKSPYLSSSIKEFWNRWHISLSTWFRDYIYIPLGGKRCSKNRQIFNLLSTFLVSGLWHGANWTYIIWGGLHGLAQVIENALANWLIPFRRRKIGHIISTLMVFIFCNFAWVFFRAESLSDAIYIVRHVFDGILNPINYFSNTIISIGQLFLLGFYISILIIYDYIDYKKNIQEWIRGRYILVQWIIYIIMGLMILFCSKKGVAAEFVYFQF